MDPSPMITTATETVSSTSALGASTACADCLTTFGVDPLIAGPIAVILGVLVRLLVDWGQRKLAERRLVVAPAPVPPPPHEPPRGAA